MRASVALNRSERTYLALEGLIGSVGQVFALRFTEPHTESELRAAARHMVRIHPRLRAVLEPTLLSYRLRVLEDDPYVDLLFDDAFRVVPSASTDALSLERFVSEIVNESFALERGLPIKVRVLGAGSSRVIVVVVHHVVSDGRGVVKMLDALMAHLNGVVHDEVPLDPPGMLPALVSASRLASIMSFWRSMRLARRDQREGRDRRTLMLGRSGGDYGVVGVRLHRMPVKLAAIREAASRLGCSVTELLLAALARGFGGEAAEDGRNAVSVRLSVDLRAFFAAARRPTVGNYVATFMLHLTRFRALEGVIAQVRAQMREGLGRFERREMGYPLLLADLVARLGRKLYGMAALATRRRGRLPAMSCHFTNLGNLALLNAHGDRARLEGISACAPNYGPFVAAASVGGELSLSVSYPRVDIETGEINAMLARFDEALCLLVRAPAPEAQTPASESAVATTALASSSMRERWSGPRKLSA